MKAPTEVAFELKTVLIPVMAISLKADFMPEVRRSRKYRQIAASIEHVGLIEPLIVSPVGDGTFLLLDGALRLDILKERQNETVRCILSTDDEGYTYNKRVSHLSNIGEHYMILKALSNGVSEQMISTSLNVDVETIRRKKSLLDGICPEAIQLLTTRRVSVHAYGFLRRMKPLGQIQAAERMIHANNYSATMAKILLTITKPDLIAQPAKTNRTSPGAAAKLSLLQEESDTLLTDVKQVEETYATQALDLTLSLGYIEHLLASVRVEKYLTKHHPNILNQFRKLLSERPMKCRALFQILSTALAAKDHPLSRLDQRRSESNPATASSTCRINAVFRIGKLNQSKILWTYNAPRIAIHRRGGCERVSTLDCPLPIFKELGWMKPFGFGANL